MSCDSLFYTILSIFDASLNSLRLSLHDKRLNFVMDFVKLLIDYEFVKKCEFLEYFIQKMTLFSIAQMQNINVIYV